MSVRLRRWLNPNGRRREAWVADISEDDGRRHLKTFSTKLEADKYHAMVMAMKNPKRPTEELNLELSKISTALTLIDEMIADSDIDVTQKKAIGRLCTEAKLAYERAFEHVGTIALHASLI